MSKLRVSRDAAAELDEIWFYIAQRGGVEVAQRYIERLHRYVRHDRIDAQRWKGQKRT